MPDIVPPFEDNPDPAGLADLIHIGETVMEMCDRVKTADLCAPGACATYKFELDDVHYKLTVSVFRPTG